MSNTIYTYIANWRWTSIAQAEFDSEDQTDAVYKKFFFLPVLYFMKSHDACFNVITVVCSLIFPNLRSIQPVIFQLPINFRFPATAR